MEDERAKLVHTRGQRSEDRRLAPRKDSFPAECTAETAWSRRLANSTRSVPTGMPRLFREAVAARSLSRADLLAQSLNLTLGRGSGSKGMHQCLQDPLSLWLLLTCAPRGPAAARVLRAQRKPNASSTAAAIFPEPVAGRHSPIGPVRLGGGPRRASHWLLLPTQGQFLSSTVKILFPLDPYAVSF